MLSAVALNSCDLVQDAASRLHQLLSQRSEPHLVVVAFEQRSAEFPLQQFDLLAERRRRDVQPVGGTLEVQLFRDRQEVLKAGEVDLHLAAQRIVVDSSSP